MKEKYFFNRTKVLKVKEKYSPWKIASVPKRGKIYFPIAASFKTGWKEFPDGLKKENWSERKKNLLVMLFFSNSTFDEWWGWFFFDWKQWQLSNRLRRWKSISVCWTVADGLRHCWMYKMKIASLRGSRRGDYKGKTVSLNRFSHKNDPS